MVNGESMQKDDCIFCKIIRGEIPCIKIWEDKDFLAVLDLNPNTEGMTLLLTKNHYDSYVFDMPDPVYKKFFLASKKLAKLMEQGLGVHRVALVMEGMGINHAHIKLYPLHGLEEKFKETWAKERAYFENYPGFISTQLGPQKTNAELEKVAEKIRKNIK
jgi:diadenosine tetraphosphate (Ap4A) HIT family hydrolase